MRTIEAILEEERQAVSYNTIRHTIATYAPPDSDSTWNVRPYEGIGQSHPHLVLEVIQEVCANPQGWRHSITNRTADWIAALRLTISDLPLACYDILAFFYRSSELNGEDTTVLDTYLAFAPWRSPKALYAYAEACRKGVVGQAPFFSIDFGVSNEDTPAERGWVYDSLQRIGHSWEWLEERFGPVYE